MQPYKYLCVNIAYESCETAIYFKDLVNRDLHRCENHKTEKFNCKRKSIFKTCASRVVSITDSRDHSGDPIIRKDDKIYIFHILKVFVRLNPRDMTFFEFIKSVTSNVDKKTTEVVYKHNNLAKSWKKKDEYFNEMFTCKNTLDDPLNWVVKQPYLVESKVSKWGVNRIRKTEQLR